MARWNQHQTLPLRKYRLIPPFGICLCFQASTATTSDGLPNPPSCGTVTMAEETPVPVKLPREFKLRYSRMPSQLHAYSLTVRVWSLRSSPQHRLGCDCRFWRLTKEGGREAVEDVAKASLCNALGFVSLLAPSTRALKDSHYTST